MQLVRRTSSLARTSVARTEYGEPFAAIIARDNIVGVQFHPEKSQKAGRVLIQNFLRQ